jgi:[ribosomal protein S18]-alanine N-acetyltransferase
MTADARLDPKHVSLLWAGPERTSEIAELHRTLFDTSWDEAAIHSLLDHPAATAFVALYGNPKVPVGFVLGQLAADEAEVLSIGVAKDWQGKGIGRRLVEGMVRAVSRAEGTSLHLEVADDNMPALVLYHRMGFVEIGRRKAYYTRDDGSTADALRLSLKL